MSRRGQIRRGEKWLRIYNDSDIEKNPVMVEDVKAFKEAAENGELDGKVNLEEMEVHELHKYIHGRALPIENAATSKKKLIKQIKAAEAAMAADEEPDEAEGE